MVSPFAQIAEQRKNSPFAKIAEQRSQEKPQEPASIKGSLSAYGSGYAGGYGGTPGDIIGLLENNLEQVPIGLSNALVQREKSPLQTTHQLSENLAEEFGTGKPKNALERILRESGQLGGQGGAIGTAIGGPIGGAIESVHGSITGALYGSLKELGFNDHVALGTSILATINPTAIPKFLKNLKSGSKEFIKEVSKLGEKSIEVGTELKTGSPNRKLAEDIIEKFAPEKFKEGQIPKIEIEGNLPGKEGGRSLEGRITTHPELGESVSKEPFHTEAAAGREISHDVKDKFHEQRAIVNEAYKPAEEITQSHNDIFPEMAYKNEQRIQELESIPKRSAGEEAVYQDALTLRSLIGTPEGLIKANASTLMKQANSFSQKVKYELPYAGYKGQIKSIVREMNDGVINSLRKSGIDPSPVIEADKIYGRFADTFYSDELKPFLEKKIIKPESLSRSISSDEGVYRAVKDAVGSRKNPIINKVDRQIVESRMGKYYDKPELIGSKQYNKDLSNLSELIGKEKIGDVDLALRKRLSMHERKALKEHKLKEGELAQSTSKGKVTGEKKLSPERVSTQTNKKVSESIGKTPEELDKAFNSVSGIRDLRKKLSDKGLSKEFESLATDKVNQIFKEGQFEGRKLTGQQIEKIINKDHEILNELIGQENVSALFKESKIAGAKEIDEARKQTLMQKATKFAVKSSAYAVGGHILKGVISIFL